MTVSSIIFAQPVALASEGGSDPQWVELVPAGPEIVANDGRRFLNDDPQAIVSAFPPGPRGLPVDVEHATQIRAEKGLDAPAYGWIRKVEERAGAIWGQITWEAQAQEWLASRAYRFISPAFRFAPETGRILRLVSAGLTNTPAFNMTALAREEPRQETDDMDKAVLEALGLAATATAADAVVAISKLKTDMATAREAAPDPAVYVPKTQLDAANQRVTELETQASAREAEAMAADVDAAIEAGKVVPANREHYLATCKALGRTKFGEMVAAMPELLGGSGLGGKQKTATAKAGDLSEDELAYCRAAGRDPVEFAKAKQEQKEA